MAIATTLRQVTCPTFFDDIPYCYIATGKTKEVKEIKDVKSLILHHFYFNFKCFSALSSFLGTIYTYSKTARKKSSIIFTSSALTVAPLA